jgi:hypothetical protein
MFELRRMPAGARDQMSKASQAASILARCVVAQLDQNSDMLLEAPPRFASTHRPPPSTSLVRLPSNPCTPPCLIEHHLHAPIWGRI